MSRIWIAYTLDIMHLLTYGCLCSDRVDAVRIITSVHPYIRTFCGPFIAITCSVYTPMREFICANLNIWSLSPWPVIFSRNPSYKLLFFLSSPEKLVDMNEYFRLPVVGIHE